MARTAEYDDLSNDEIKKLTDDFSQYCKWQKVEGLSDDQKRELALLSYISSVSVADRHGKVEYTLSDALKQLNTMLFDNDPLKGWKATGDDNGVYLESLVGDKIMVLSKRESRIFKERCLSMLYFRTGQIGREGEIYQTHQVTIGDDDYYTQYCTKCWHESAPILAHPGYSGASDPCPKCRNPNFRYHYRAIPREYVDRKTGLNVSSLMDKFGT